jgi:hypothetical protein
MTTCVDGTERQATIAFALVAAGLTTRPVMRTVPHPGTSHRPSLSSESRREQDIGVSGMFWKHELRKSTPVMNKAGNAPFHVIDRDGSNWTACWSELN